MNPQIVSLCIIGVLSLALLLAAYLGHRVPQLVIVTLIVVGACVVLAPTAFSFALQIFSKRPEFTEDERITCWILGGVMTMVGIVAAIVPVRRRPIP